jgi:peroxiredoxin Q/BCP
LRGAVAGCVDTRLTATPPRSRRTRTTPISARTPLPDFDLQLGGGGRLRRGDLLGRRTVLYFYPKDDTPGCTVEGREFTALRDDFRAAGLAVYGVSPDSPGSHQRFAAKCNLGIPLISDPDHVLVGALGLWVEKSMYGRTYEGVERSTFLVGEDGAIEREWRHVKAKGHAATVLEAARPAG